MNENWKLEDDVNDWVKSELNRIGLKKSKDFTVESGMSPYMKESLKGAAKTNGKTNFGKPDFQIENYSVPVILENKLHLKNLINETNSGLKMDNPSVSKYAVNGGLFYAQSMIASGSYSEVIVIGVAGDYENNVQIKPYYVFSSLTEPKLMQNVTTIDFLQNKDSFDSFLKDARLSESEKHQILINTQQDLQKQAKKLSILMNNHNITAAQRVIYVSGALLAMQDIVNTNTKEKLDNGLTPDDLTGKNLDQSRDGDIIVNHIYQFLNSRQIPTKKLNLMVSSFKNAIQIDIDRDIPVELDRNVAKLLKHDASVNKQVFTFIFKNVFKAIDGTSGHLDIMGEMYSEFLKYALGDGKGIGIVLTPPYVTEMMTKIIDVNMNSRVMDLATGSAGFLISSMTEMISDANNHYGRNTDDANKKIKKIRADQLLGVELNAQMFTLAATNMILRGDGSSHIEKGDSFHMKPNIYAEFKPDRLLLNPPFSHKEHGMPFVEYGLRYLAKGSKAAVIIQDSAGSGIAVATNKEILKHNTLIASIKMPIDTFQPSAGVQTSVYIFEAGKPHDFDRTVRFVDFRNDGYKRTKRSTNEIDHPVERYQDIVKIYKAGSAAKLGDHADLWKLDDIVLDDQINNSGADWNFEQHKIIETTPTEEDFIETVGKYLNWEVDQLLAGNDENNTD